MVPEAQDTVITQFDATTKTQKLVHVPVKGAPAAAPLDPSVQKAVDAACAAVTDIAPPCPSRR